MAGTPCIAASRAAPTVPEMYAVYPRLYPRLIPDTTRSGSGFRMFRMATLTVVAGVAVNPIAFSPFGSVRSSRRIGSLVTIECPFPLWFSDGPTMITWPIAWRICATAASPGARTPSSLLIRIRYGGGLLRADRDEQP